MSMIPRTLAPVLHRLFGQYPVVTVSGPRQSGKTTLCRAELPDLEYVNLERPDVRARAVDDPIGFLHRLRGGAILDEVQRVPELLSYVQTVVDERDTPRQFVVTGSHNLAVSEAVSQSLAGRTALLRLLPFSIAECDVARPGMSVEDRLFTGFYPRIYDHDLDPVQALGDYFETYVERDVRQLSELRNLSLFERFIRMCAGRIGQLLNLQSLGNDVGVSHTTARQWLSLLEASFVVFVLPPFHANLSKRLVKTPKLYFHDVGLASNLLGIEEAAQLTTHPLRGPLFENLVVAEALKHRFNTGRRSNLSFYRDSSGAEIDLLYSVADRVLPIEVKSGQTVTPSMLTGFERIRSVLGERVAGSVLVYGGNEAMQHRGVRVIPAHDLSAELEASESPG